MAVFAEIREANESDIPAIVKLGSRSLLDGPYKDKIKDNPEQSAETALTIIRKSGKVLVWEEDNQITGLLAFIMFPHYFSGELTAGEMMWYVVPEARKGGAALKLLWEAEKLAKQMGAVSMQFTSPSREVDALYNRFGYKPVETTYMKRLI